MTVSQAQREVSSAEFTRWIAFYVVEGELQSGVEREPEPSGLGGKIHAWAAMQNAKQGRA